MRSRVPINIAVAHRRANKSNNNNEAFSGFLKVGGTLIFLKSFRGKDPLDGVVGVLFMPALRSLSLLYSLLDTKPREGND